MSKSSVLFNSIFLNSGEEKELNYLESYLCSFNSNKTKISHINVTLPSEHIDKVLGNFEKLLGLPIDSFEVEKEIDNAVYKFTDTDNLNYYSTILNTLNNTDASDKMSILDKIPAPRKLSFIIHKLQYKIKDDIQQFFIVAKQDRIALNQKKSVFIKSNEDFKIIAKENFYVFNPSITCIFMDDNIFITNYKAFINLFKYKEYLETRVKKTITFLESEGIISNFKDYKEALNHYRNFHALTKVPEDTNEIKSTLQHDEYQEKIKKIETHYECYFKFDSDNTSFEISDEMGLKIMIRILSNSAGFDFFDNPITFASRYSLQKKETFVPSK